MAQGKVPTAEKTVVGEGRQEGKASGEGLGEEVPALG